MICITNAHFVCFKLFILIQWSFIDLVTSSSFIAFNQSSLLLSYDTSLWLSHSFTLHSLLSTSNSHPIPMQPTSPNAFPTNTHNKNKNKNKTTHDTPIAVFDAIPETTTAKTQAGFPTNSKIRCDSSQIACVMNRFPSSTLPIRSLRAVSHFALVASFSFPRLSAKSCGPAVLQRANCPARNRGVVWIRFYRWFIQLDFTSGRAST